MLQIAWERGLLDLETYSVEQFTEKGTKNAMGNIMEETCLTALLPNCSDFIEEESLLQMNIRKLGAVCTHSPKYHCELAGEGIEYSWGNAKMKYRRMKWSDKKDHAQFVTAVRLLVPRLSRFGKSAKELTAGKGLHGCIFHSISPREILTLMV